MYLILSRTSQISFAHPNGGLLISESRIGQNLEFLTFPIQETNMELCLIITE